MDVKEAGKQGGETTKAKYGTEHYRRMAKLSIEVKHKRMREEKEAKRKELEEQINEQPSD
jgi:hypothetical protein